MSLLIRVERGTLDFIAELNGGIKPQVTEIPEIFIYHGREVDSEFISVEDAIKRYFEDETVQPGQVEFCIYTRKES